MKVVVFLLFVFPFCLFSQDIEYARQVISELSSKEFHGRAYTNKGDKIAADYIKQELIKLNIKAVNNSYFQEFNISANTITSKIQLKIDDNKLVPGEDFVILNSSEKCKGKYILKKIDTSFFSNPVFQDYSKTFIVIDINDFKTKEQKEAFHLLKYTNFVKARGIIDISKSKPSQIQSQKANNFVTIELCKEKFNTNSQTISIGFRNKFHKKYTTQNIIGYIEGKVDTFIMFGGHYDHLGDMGKYTFFPGANDNASGCAMILNLAKYYSNLKTKPYYSIAFVFFSAEELGILGSKYFSENPVIPLSKIKFFFNLDLVGTGEEGIKVVNGSILKKEFNLLTSINKKNNYLPKISPRGEAMNSDHYFIHKKGVKSVFIYTLGGYSEYHNIYDIAETLKLTGFENLFKLLIDFVDTYK